MNRQSTLARGGWLDRRTDLDELRDGGPTDTPGVMTTTGGSAGPASIRRRARPGAAPTTTGDAGSGGMHGPTGTWQPHRR